MKITHAPLFTGINGFGRAADMLGWEQTMHSEIDDFCQRLIQYYWKNSIPCYDITKTDFTFLRGRIDVLSGGFPCQPFSHAGMRNGTNDHRYLWPENLRAVREIQPVAVVGENVTGLLSMEQHEMFARVDSRRIVRFENYDEFEGIYTRQATMLVNDICEDLEKEGYAVQPFVVPAAGVGAPHKRDRIWFIAYSDERAALRRSRLDAKEGKGKGISERDQVQQSNLSNGLRGFSSDTDSLRGNGGRPNSSRKKKGEEVRPSLQFKVEGSCCEQSAPDSAIKGPKKRKQDGRWSDEEKSGTRMESESERLGRFKTFAHSGIQQLQGSEFGGSLGEEGQTEGKGRQFGGPVCDFWKEFPTQPPICGGDDGLPTELDGITFSNWRNESIKAYGNAIVPQVAYQFFKALDEKLKE